MTIELTPTAERTRWRSLPPLALLPLAALAWWAGGFLSWILDGLGSQLDISARAIPLFAGGVADLVLGAGLGGVLGGLVACLGSGSRGVRAGACATGVGIAVSATLVQTRTAGGIGGDERIADGLTLVVLVVTIVGLAIGLSGVTGRVGLGLAVGAVAGAVPMWLLGVFDSVGLGNTADEFEVVRRVSEWTGAVLLAMALVAVGLRTAARAAAWPAVMLLAWFIGPTITAAGYMDVFLRPGMGLPDMWGDHLSATMDVWRMAASPHGRSLTPWIVAVVVAGGVALWLVRRPTAQPDQPAQ